ncbi:MAG TPA: hypothetical protein VM120_08305 [Bryobacteraceae bacterium]|nr:hypothetical protein [Bryobacteraceae bacterium]
MLFAAAALLIAGAVLFTLGVREKDIPASEPPSPFLHLDQRKNQIYENLRDLQFEYRVGKLSEEDYNKTKVELQRELAKVMAQIDEVKGQLRVASAPAVASKPTVEANVCPHCGAKFDQPLKYCGECGKAMKGAGA